MKTPFFRSQVAACAVILAAPSPALGASKLDFRGIEGCDTAAAFEREVAARGIDVDAALDENSRLFVRVSAASDTEQSGQTAGGHPGPAQPGPARYRGMLWVEGARGATERREIAGASCSEVLSALGVVATIALEPGESEAQERQPMQDGPQGSSEQSKDEYESHHFAGSSEWGQEEVDVPAGKLQFDPLVSMSLGYGGAWGPSRDVSQGIEFSIELANGVTTPSGQQRIFGPIGRLRGGLSEAYTRLALGICATPYFNLSGFAVLGCAEFGFVHFADLSSGADSDHEPIVRTFGTMGASLELRYNFAKHWHVGTGLGYDFLLGSPPDEPTSFDWPGSLRFSLTAGYHF